VLVLAFAALQVVIVRDAWRARASPSADRRTVALTLLGTTLALVPMHLLFPYYTASGLPQVVWIFLGLLAGSQVAAPTAAAPRRRASVTRATP
jgi:hypothetical protein